MCVWNFRFVVRVFDGWRCLVVRFYGSVFGGLGFGWIGDGVVSGWGGGGFGFGFGCSVFDCVCCCEVVGCWVRC